MKSLMPLGIISYDNFLKEEWKIPISPRTANESLSCSSQKACEQLDEILESKEIPDKVKKWKYIDLPYKRNWKFSFNRKVYLLSNPLYVVSKGFSSWQYRKTIKITEIRICLFKYEIFIKIER